MSPEPLIAIFDTETTGLTLHPDAELRKQPRIIEFGGVLLGARSGEIVEEVSQLIHPRESVTAEITKITGITNEMLIHQPNFEEFAPQVEAYFAKASAVMAHNLPFDRAMVFNEMTRIGTTVSWPKIEVCTVGIFKEIWGRNPKLTELYEWTFNKPLAQTHRALDDVRALVEIILHHNLHHVIFP